MAVFIELPHFIMERKMRLGIKRRARQNHHADKPVLTDSPTT
jgi:hypothetical protein